MLSKELVGTRIRRVRAGLHKTLKEVEAASGFSSTHISEIERGRTSPTIGTLIRIANALNKDPSYFIEERELEEVSVTSESDRPASVTGLDLAGSGIRLDSLTRGILGGRLLAYELLLEAQGSAEVSHLPETGDLCLICLSGVCTLTLTGRATEFREGDSLHLPVTDANLALRAGDQTEARVLILMDPREAIFP